MTSTDDNDLLRAGALPLDPAEDSTPMTTPKRRGNGRNGNKARPQGGGPPDGAPSEPPEDDDEGRARREATAKRLRKRIGRHVAHVQVTAKGRLYRSSANAAIILAHDTDFGDCGYNTDGEVVAHRTPALGFDELAQQVAWLRPPPDCVGLPVPSGHLLDHHATYVAAWLHAVSHEDFGAAVHAGIEAAARMCCFNPVVSYLESLRWDNLERLSTWLCAYLGAEQTGITCSIARWWLIGCIARAYTPGCRVDHMLILEGPQGRKKSTAVQVLAGPWYSPGPERLNDKDGPQSLRGKWIVEMSELEAMKGRELAAVKKFLTDTVDVYRPSHGRNTVTLPRRCCFIGTTNETTYLHDPTGARRFWPVRIGEIDIPAVARDRDQLFAEAVAAYKARDGWWPTADAHVEKLTALQDERYEEDSWTERVADFLDGRGSQQLAAARDAVTIDEVLVDCLGIERGRCGRAEQMRASAILKRLGWDRRRVTARGARAWAYFRPSSGGAR